MKNMLMSILMLSAIFPASAMKKKQQKPLTYLSGTYSINEGPVRKVGTIYELKISTKEENITVDSVWFGATPVPCDLLETKTRHKIDKAVEKGTYIVRANKNLYENFHAQVDSTSSYKSFKRPFAFKGDAVIMYKVKGKRYYTPVTKVKQVKAKGHRD